MDFTIRPARADDADAVGEFTANTFEWGDYVTDVFDYWLRSHTGLLLVAANEQDRAVAISRGEMLSPAEMWLQGTRVGEEWRRRGVASALSRALVEWGVNSGARVARLLTEVWNEPAQRQVETIGFRRSSEWIAADLGISASEPVMSGNGGQRAKARRKLEVAHSSEAVPAWVSWRSGPLLRPARGLHASGWRWSQLTAEHLIAAGKKGRLWSSQAGWAVTRRDDEVLYIDWLECGPDDAMDMVRSIIDLAQESEADRLRVMAPQVDWLISALERCGGEMLRMYLYEKPL